MEKDQLDSLATVAVGSEKIPSAHSHYAASEVYSASESPPAYTRPLMKSTAVQIARIIATTMIAISVIIGSFILASAWLEARASCTPESIALMQAQMNLQQPQNEYIKHLQPEALVQDRDAVKDNLQNLSPPSSFTDKDEVPADTKDIKIENDKNEKTKADNDNGDQNDSDEDYDDPEFPPVHIKLPLQLDLDNLAGTLLQQSSRNTVSCVVEHHKSTGSINEENDNELNRNDTEHQIGEHVAIICESGYPRQEQQDQEMLMPIIVPLGTVQIPLQPQDSENERYQVHNQYQVPEPRRVPIDTRGMNIPFPMDILPSALRNAPRVSMEMGPPPRIFQQQHMMQSQPIEMRRIEVGHMQMDPLGGRTKLFPKQDQFVHEQQQSIPITFAHPNRPSMMNPQQQTQGMMPPPPPPPPQSHSAHESQEQVTEPTLTPLIDVRLIEQKHTAESQEDSDRFDSPLPRDPFGLRKIMNRFPMEINNIFQRITGRVSPAQSIIPEGIRRGQVQTLESLPEGIRSIPINPFASAMDIRNLIERGHSESHPQRNPYRPENEQQDAKPFPSSEDSNDEDDGPVPAAIMSFIHQIQGSGSPLSGFAIASRPMETLEVPVEAQAHVSDSQANDEGNREREPASNMQQQEHRQPRMMVHQEIQNEANRPHLIQPRSVRSVPNNPFEEPKKRVRRCDCNCAC